jgi:hypothetical protein
MKVTLKNIKHHARMSEETNAFEADLYVDGKKVGYAYNDGHGGESSIQITVPEAGLAQRLYAWGKALPPVPSDSKYGPLPDSLGFYIDRLVSEHLEAKEEAKIERAILTKATKYRAAGHFPWVVRWYDDRGRTTQYLVAASRTAAGVDADVATIVAKHGGAPKITKF